MPWIGDDMRYVEPNSTHRARPSPAILALGLVVLILGLVFVLWSSRHEPRTLEPVPSPQAPP